MAPSFCNITIRHALPYKLELFVLKYIYYENKRNRLYITLSGKNSIFGKESAGNKR
jgi:hypothetical protein